MSKIFPVLVLLLAFHETCYGSPINEDSDLLLALLVFRHGDRTPLAASLQYSTDSETLSKLSQVYGFGQLTNKGIQRAYEVGQFMRERYNGVLSPRYNKSEIYIRSTDSTRTKMSVLATMAAVYPPTRERVWNPQLNWIPTPYTTVPASIDYNLAALNCPIFLDHYEKMTHSKDPEMKKYSGLFEELAKFWHDFRQTPLLIFEAYDTLMAQLGMGLPLDPRLEKLFPKVQEAAYKAWDLVYGDNSYLAIQSGALLKSFFDSADHAIAGKPTEKVRIMSGHDFSVYPFLATTQVYPRPGIPKFGSVFGLELRKVQKTRQYIVVPYYVSQPGEEIQYLQIKGCEKQCDIEDFRRIVGKYLLSESEWRAKCNVTDATTDFSIIE